MFKWENLLIKLMINAVLSLILAFPIMAAEFPTKSVTLVAPWGAGGALDIVSRALANGAKKYLGQPVIVENKTGGAGIMGTQYVFTKPPDGYTIGMTALNPLLISYHTGALDRHPTDDFTHIMRVCGTLFGLAVRADSPWKNIQQFVQYAQANPGKVSYASSGAGTAGHINMEEFALLAKFHVTHIPYKSGNESSTALLGGHVEALSDATWAPLVSAGKFRVLLIYANERSPRYPPVPIPRDIVSENVRPNYYLLFARKEVPKSVIKKLHDAFRGAMNEPGYQPALEQFNLAPLYLNSEDCEKAVHDEIVPFGNLVQKLGLQKK